MYQRVVLLSLAKVQSIDIEFTDITYEAGSAFRGRKKQILKGISGSFKSGELCAIMGPSGAGKSTLLNILTGFEGGKWQGQIEYIGNDGGKHTWKEYRKQSCYIQQDDKLHPFFSVWEAMWMAVNLKIGASLSRKAKQMLIDDVLDNLDLSKSKQTRCSQLSGGQKKRLSIALELLDNPPVMFLDEPTTGLDSLSSQQCIRLLHSLAKAGRTIVCTIHQPSAAVYELFDNVYLLADGRCMYDGATSNTIAYFASVGLHCPKYHNPADFMIEVVNMEYGNYSEQLAKLAGNKEKSWRLETSQSLKKEAEKVKEIESKATVLIRPPSEMRRFLILLRCCALQLVRDWTMLHLRVAVHLFTGVMLGVLFNSFGEDGSKTVSNVGFFLVTCVYLCYTSMMPAVLTFPSEFPTLKKERFNNWYQLRTYYVASLVCNLPLQLLFVLVFCFPSYFLTKQPMDVNRYFMFVGVAIMTVLMAESFGLLIGTLVDPINGTFIGAILTCFLLSMSGFLCFLSHMPQFLYYTSYISGLRYSMHAMVQATYGFSREKLYCPKKYCHYRMPQTILTDLSMADGKYWVDIVVLFSYYVVLKLVAYCTLKRKLSMA